MIFRARGNPYLVIPSYSDVWDSPYSPKPFLPNPNTTVLSAHYLNGINVKINRPLGMFTFIRDPRELILSGMQSPAVLNSFSRETDLHSFIRKSLRNYRKEIGHLCYQLFELATPNHQKTAPYVHGKSEKVFDPENLIGSEPIKLLEKVKAREDTSLRFIGITEIFSQSCYLLFAMLGIKEIPLWRPGLFTYRKIRFSECPRDIQDDLTELTKEELHWYLEEKAILEKRIKSHFSNLELSKYVECNKMGSIKFLQGLEERLELGKANRKNNAERKYVKTIFNEVQELLNHFNE